MTVVLDSSAVLAFFFGEPAGDVVASALAAAVVPASGWAEVLQKAHERGSDLDEIEMTFEQLGVNIAPLTAPDARVAASLWVRGRGLSLADRFCIALGRFLDVPIWTCDRAWVDVDRRVVVIR